MFYIHQIIFLIYKLMILNEKKTFEYFQIQILKK